MHVTCISHACHTCMSHDMAEVYYVDVISLGAMVIIFDMNEYRRVIKDFKVIHTYVQRSCA